MDEVNIFFLYAWPVAIGLIGWMAKAMVDRVQKDLDDHKAANIKLQNELNEVKLTYVHKQDMKEIKEEIMARFTRFEDLLESLRK